MTWTTWIILGLVLGGAGCLWYRVNNHKSGAVSCCGCGECARTGECVMVKGKKHVKKERHPS
ncbi:hypothetical protein [Dysosmobacter sp. HCP28S3_G4]|uniref:hypothetical protein n=1 Tax=Dysosmobacter sp. HCP28S3_G4 TaxID=3438938 RepID=UPI003F8BAEB5|nr:hypothetical protein [Dysosmobacter sp.]